MAAVTFWTLSKKETVRPEVNAFDRLSDFLSLAITSQFLRDQASDSEEVVTPLIWTELTCQGILLP